MRTLLPDPPPPEIAETLEELLERRRLWGADRNDEVWEGVLHMNPVPHIRHGQLETQLAVLLTPLARERQLLAVGQFNLGERNDYRVPDGGLVDPSADGVFIPTAALVVEILSPGDDTWKKLPFYAAHAVDELLIVDPHERAVRWLARNEDGTGYHDVAGSALVDLTAAQLAERIDWPA